MIRKINVKDAARVQELINNSAKKNQVLPRSLNDIYENLRDFFVYVDDGQIRGCCALHITWDDLAEIRSLVVQESMRLKGFGKELVQACCREAEELKVKKIFLLTEKTEFFSKVGFKKIDKTELPHKIWNDCLQCIQFPNCNEEAMAKQIEKRVGRVERKSKNIVDNEEERSPRYHLPSVKLRGKQVTKSPAKSKKKI